MLKKLIAVSLLSATFVAPIAAADTVSETCTVDAGAPFVAISSDAANVGGCNLVGEVTHASATVDSLTVGDEQFCGIFADDNADGIADRELAEGDTVEKGASITAFCDAGVDLENSITLVH